MATLALTRLPAFPPRPPGPPSPLRWTVEQFHALGDYGVFEGLRARLIDGIIIEEGPMNPPHGNSLERTDEAIRAALGPGWRIRVQLPLVLGARTDPLPDLAAIARTPGPLAGHPTAAGLVVEISDSSLRYDLTQKMSLYASAGVPEYWVVDVEARRLVVHRSPQPDAAQPFGHGYADVREYGATDSVSPLSAPTASVAVADLLP